MCLENLTSYLAAVFEIHLDTRRSELIIEQLATQQRAVEKMNSTFLIYLASVCTWGI